MRHPYAAAVTELKQDFARQFVEFEDPTNPHQVYRCDLTWLTSNWNCIWGRGCGGIQKGYPQYGCCANGAHFSDKDDEQRVAKYVDKLTPETWEHYKAGHRRWTEKDEDGARKTRIHNDGCIFLNSDGFPGGSGCALHHEAARRGVSIAKTKPDVCWQLPIRRDYEWIELPDGVQKLRITIEEYQRSGWGPGGHDLHWYCSSNTDAHTGAKPVYVGERDVLIEMMGKRAYAVLKEHCDTRLEMLNAARAVAKRTGDAKEVRKVMLSLAAHPATEANL